MTKKPQQFGRPRVDLESDVPEYLRGKPKTVGFLSNAEVTDFAWSGDDGALEPSSLVAGLVEPNTLLRMIVEAVVAAHPTEKEPQHSRVATAMKALVGEAPPRGRKPSEWYERPLIDVATEYLAGFYGLKPAHQSADSLAQFVLQKDPSFHDWGPEQQTNRKDVLRDKFMARKDELLARVSAGNDYDIAAARARVKTAIAAIRNLGVDASETVSENPIGGPSRE